MEAQSVVSQLFLIHGFMGSAMNWNSFAHAVQKSDVFAGYEVSALNLRWHGGHSLVENERIQKYGKNQDLMQMLGDDLVSQISASLDSSSKDDSIVIVAHSFSLRPILHSYKKLTQDFNLEAVVFVDTAPEIKKSTYTFLKDVVSSAPLPFQSRSEAKDYFESKYSDKPLSRFFMSNIREFNGVFDWRFNASALLQLLDEAYSMPLWDEWQNFDEKIFLVLGEKSDHILNETLQKTIDLRSSKFLKISKVPNAGHWVHADNPAGFLSELEAIISSV